MPPSLSVWTKAMQCSAVVMHSPYRWGGNRHHLHGLFRCHVEGHAVAPSRGRTRGCIIAAFNVTVECGGPWLRRLHIARFLLWGCRVYLFLMWLQGLPLMEQQSLWASKSLWALWASRSAAPYGVNPACRVWASMRHVTKPCSPMRGKPCMQGVWASMTQLSSRGTTGEL